MIYEYDQDMAIKKAIEYGIPEYMHDALTNWVNYGWRITPGPFLCAVISNNLRKAVQQADDNNIHLLSAYVHWFYNWAPAQCWGSQEAVEGWEGVDAEKPEPTGISKQLKDLGFKSKPPHLQGAPSPSVPLPGAEDED